MHNEANTNNQVDSRSLEGLDFRLKCQWLHDGGETCTQAAEWVGIFPCCDFTFFVCQLHQVGGEVAMATGKTVHMRCEREIGRMDWISV